MAYATICVEIKASLDIPRSVDAELRDSSLVSVYVDIMWLLAKCSKCSVFGHGDKVSPKNTLEARTSNPTKVWIPKVQKVTEEGKLRGMPEFRVEARKNEFDNVIEEDMMVVNFIKPLVNAKARSLKNICYFRLCHRKDKISLI